MTEIGSPVAQAPAPTSAEASQFDTTAARKQWQVILRRFLRHKAAVVGLGLFVLLVLFAFLGGLVWKYPFTDLGFKRYLPPSADHPFGTDRLGGDMVALIIRGTQFSIQIALVVALVSTVIGVVLGALAGYLRGWVDSVISRFIDLLLVIPSIVIAAVLVRNSFVLSVAGGSNSNWLVVALYLGLIGWLAIARVIRGMVLSLREKEFIEAARALGASTTRIIFKHILPNTVDVIIVNATLAIAQAVLLEAALSFIGLGVQSPDTSLGLMISLNKNELTLHPWLFFIPFAFIVLISLSVNFMGDGLRDAFDPRQKRVKA
ncbi:ABC transporter permease [Saccharothrix variisporea]|uniref:Oligopeptide transport system permease protein OppC n=1 Tax=Saccharothrix variisporea TaxID=543527 RepID=A0A495XC16_9PSEU|nr:ABC transporter permease [Saccharothrix variisporea]RKT70665.1 peptide/nickel transport system permease protein [Saccharothrix variisporea]